MPRFRSKVVEIEAIPFRDRFSLDEMQSTWGQPFKRVAIMDYSPPCSLKLITLEGQLQASLGDYIIRGTEGEFYPCKPSVFHRKYEPV